MRTMTSCGYEQIDTCPQCSVECPSAEVVANSLIYLLDKNYRNKTSFNKVIAEIK